MIKLFEVKGFKNFKDKITLDFTKVRDYKFNTNCVSDGLVKKAIIYGKNSIGKSNFGLALFDIVEQLFISYHPSEIENTSFLNIFNSDGFAEFHYIFQFGNDEIDYLYKKTSTTGLFYEKIRINDKLLYDYNYMTKEGDFQGIKEYNSTLNLSFHGIKCIWIFLLNNTVAENVKPLLNLYNFVSSMLWFRTADDKRYISAKYKTEDFFTFIQNKDTLKEFEELLHESGMTEKLIVRQDIDGQKRLYIDAPNPLNFWDVASSGTKALYGFFYWYKTTAPSFIFIDEFDAFFHYELSETVVKLLDKFTSSQVILTSHNTNLLTNRIMRPDCFFIMTKDKLTSFADATSRELREGHNLEKLYISGEFDGE